jgi:hypothetical protein
VTEENIGYVPRRRERFTDVDGWVRGLNAFYDDGIGAFIDQRLSPEGEPLWSELVAYQAPLPGTRENATSVVYGRPTDTFGNPRLPSRRVVDWLAESGVRRVVVGHTPSGDCPAIVRDDGFEMILADTSYAPREPGASVTLRGARVEVRGRTLIDERSLEVAFDGAIDDGSPVGRVTPEGALVKSQLARGDYLLFRAFEGYRSETRVAVRADLDPIGPGSELGRARTA